MNRETRVALIEKEIETYERMVTVAQAMIPVIECFDNKILNVKLEKAIENDVLGYDDGNYVHNQSIGHCNIERNTNYVNIVISLNVEPIQADGCGCHYVQNETSYFSFGYDCFNQTESGKLRVNADAMKERVLQKIETIKRDARILSESLAEVDTMLAEAKALEEQVKAFTNKYSCRVQEVFRCSYRLENKSRYF